MKPIKMAILSLITLASISLSGCELTNTLFKLLFPVDSVENIQKFEEPTPPNPWKDTEGEFTDILI
jgi:hypothetical protein